MSSRIYSHAGAIASNIQGDLEVTGTITYGALNPPVAGAAQNNYDAADGAAAMTLFQNQTSGQVTIGGGIGTTTNVPGVLSTDNIQTNNELKLNSDSSGNIRIGHPADNATTIEGTTVTINGATTMGGTLDCDDNVFIKNSSNTKYQNCSYKIFAMSRCCKFFDWT